MEANLRFAGYSAVSAHADADAGAQHSRKGRRIRHESTDLSCIGDLYAGPESLVGYVDRTVNEEGVLREQVDATAGSRVGP